MVFLNLNLSIHNSAETDIFTKGSFYLILQRKLERGRGVKIKVFIYTSLGTQRCPGYS